VVVYPGIGLAKLVWLTVAASLKALAVPGVALRERKSGAETMAIISQGVLVLAIGWTMWQLVRVRRQLRRGAMVVPPLVAATLIFALGSIVVIVTGVSPLHLLWWFPCSFIVGLVVLVFPLGTHLLLRFLVLFAGSMESSERPQPQAWRDARGGRGKSKRRHSARAPRRTLALT
jgi:hypothetical protein